jgi:hypothetical protein
MPIVELTVKLPIKSVYRDIIKSNMGTAGMSRDKYFWFLEECKNRA